MDATQDRADNIRPLQTKIDALADEYGEAAMREAVANIGKAKRSRKPGGRPKEFDHQHLINLWLFVEAGKRKAGLSAHKVCKQAEFSWLVAGGNSGVTIAKTISGTTLRRRYQEARALLKAEGPKTEDWLNKMVEVWLEVFALCGNPRPH